MPTRPPSDHDDEDPASTPDEPTEDGAITIPEPMRQRLIEARKVAHLSRAELGRRLGISGTQVYRIEKGLRGTTPTRLQQWLVECGYGVDFIEVGTSDPQRQALLLSAIGSLDKVHLEPLLKIVLAWPRLGPKDRRTILSVVEPADE